MDRDENAKNISVSELKAKCLALVEEVSRTGLSLVVTKRGKPIARLVPVQGVNPPSLLESVSYKQEADLLSPVDEVWEADS